MMERAWFGSYAKGVPRELEYERTPMHQALDKTAQELPENTALIFLDSKISYGRLNDLA